MPKISPEQQAAEWAVLLAEVPPTVLEHISELAKRHQAKLATHFYEHMLGDPTASQFLSHDQVRERLHASMQRWVVAVLSARAGNELMPVIAQQIQIGEVHARIGVPVHLVLRGARQLKACFAALLNTEPAPDDRTGSQALKVMSGVIDTAMEVMSQAYSSSHDRNSRAAEAYRLFSVSQHMGSERERQRAALLAWENQLMFDQAVGTAAAQWPRIGGSEFGLWFRHKGAHAFSGATEADLILESMDRIDNVLLPMCASGVAQADRVQRLRDFREATKAIGFHLDTLFEQNNELEAGRDVLTRLLNRKFVPVVLGKEVTLARQRKTTFALLALDIDHFKQVNDTHGHEAGDMVLQQLAAILSNTSRGGDYIFRMGGEEFLILLVDVNTVGAQMMAEKLRKVVEAETFRLPLDKTMHLTISAGLAVHNGHPDYQRTLRLADEALYKAKHAGRNRVVQADE